MPKERGSDAIAWITARAIAAPDPELPLDACALPAAMAGWVEASIVVVTPVEPRDRHDRVALRPRLAEGGALGLHPAVFARFSGLPLLVCLPRSAAAKRAALAMLIRPRMVSAKDGSFLAAPASEVAFGLWYATLAKPHVPYGGAFSSTAMIEAAFAIGTLDLHAPVDVRFAGRRERTTVGRALLREALPASVPLDLGRPLHAGAARRMLEALHCTAGARAARAAAEALWGFGLRFATRAGLSIGAEDLRVPEDEKEAILDEARRAWGSALEDYQAGTATRWELEVRPYDAFVGAARRMRDALPRWFSMTHPLRAIRDAGAGLGDDDLVRLVGVLPPVWSLAGELWTCDRSLSDGVSAHQAWARAAGEEDARFGAREYATSARALRWRLADVLGNVRITRFDCGATGGMTVRAVVSDLRVVTSLGARLVGRVALEDILSSNGSVLVRAGSVVDERAAAAIDRRLVPRARIRSVLACAARDGVCARCHGWDRATRSLPAIGAAVGLDAADMVAALRREAMPRLITIVGGTFSRWALRSCRSLPAPGRAHYEGIELVDLPVEADEPMNRVMMANLGRVTVHDEGGEEIAAYEVRKGYRLHCEHGASLARGAQPVSTYLSGEPVIADIPAGATAVVSWDATRHPRYDEVVGRELDHLDIHRVHLRGKTADGGAFEQIIDCEGDEVSLMVDEGQAVQRGQLIALDRRGDGAPESCDHLDIDQLLQPPSLARSHGHEMHEAWRHRDPAGFAEHLVADLEEAILGAAPRVGTVWFELVARALVRRTDL